MGKFNLVIGLTILLTSNFVQASEYEFKFIYSPEYAETCSSISDSNIYLQRNKSRLNFRLLMDMSKEDSKALISKASEYSFKIYSYKGTKLIVPDTKPIKVISFSDFVEDSIKYNTVLGLDVRIKIPKKIKKSSRFDENGIKFNSWNIIVVLQSNATDKVISLSSYSLQFLPSGLSFYEKIESTTKHYSLTALPDSELYDNSNGMETLVVNKFYEDSIIEANRKEKMIGYGFGFDLNSNYNFSVIDTDYYQFFNENYHSYGPIMDYSVIAFSAFDIFNKSKFVKVTKNHSLMNHFEILPGSSAILFEQAHVEEAEYKVFSANECGFLAEAGYQTKSVMTYSYHMIPVDRTQYLEEKYLEELGAQFIPTYDFR